MPRKLTLVFLSIVLTGCGGGYSVSDGKDMCTPLERAAQAGDLSEVQRLLTGGADPNEKDDIFGSPLTAAAARNHNAPVIRALIDAGANVNGRNQEGNQCWGSPIWNAAGGADLESMRVLLDAGAAIGNTSCRKLVVGWLQVPAIELLRERGLDLSGVDGAGRNALHLALAPPAAPPFESIRYLVRAGVPLNARDRAGKTPLAYWREPREMENHALRAWLVETLSHDEYFEQQRSDRTRIGSLLEKSGARL